ncbi:MAG TPA: UPF0182 family protein [Blastocatellia bacterium]|nr:UPF0182 family protein [Blastocatellia bacterium]
MQSEDELPDDFPRPKPKRRGGSIQTGRPRMSRFRLLALAVVALVIILPMGVGQYTDLLWFQQLGYQIVFSTTLFTKAALGAAVGLITAAFVLLNLKLALRLSPETSPIARHFVIEGQEIPAPNFSALAPRLAPIVALAVGAFAGLAGWGSWETFLRFRHQVPFAETDPIFGRDIAFYVFTLPALDAVSEWLMLIVIVSLVGAALIYVVHGAIDFGNTRMSFSIERGARSHLLCLFATLFLILAFEAYLSRLNLLFGGSGPVSGASYTDIHASMPIFFSRIVIAVIVSALAIASVFFTTNRLIGAGIGLYLLTIAAGWLYPAALQRFSVAPNELAKETPYIQYSIAATRKAFALDRVEEREISGERTLSSQDIQKNRQTINNIRLWDRDPLLETFSQLQEIRPYYDFHEVDNDRYRINGELKQVMLSPRELPPDSVPNRNWINEHLTYTHGFGLTLGPVDQVTSQGQPLLYIKDIPPASSAPSLKIDRPEIYFGEKSNDRVYVKTAEKEFNFPTDKENVYKNYEGEGGVSIGSRWRQLLFAIRFGDLKLLLSNAMTPESRVLFDCNILQRLRQIAPYLHFDDDPYLVINDGRLFWIADAYTRSDRYPYSETVNGVNYIRNSVKAVVDAYHGHTQLYIADERDPLIQTYARIYPATLKPLTEMPEGLRAHLRYPEEIFELQTRVYATYHMDQPQTFYNKEDLWTAASMGESGEKAAPMKPYYTIMKLPGERSEEFILMLPFTPNRKDNLAAWMAARSDGEHYGKLVVYRFPKQKVSYGPKQVVGFINQDPEISRQRTLWDQRGSSVNMGTLMVIPIEESLIYVQPLYLRAESVRIPELRRVIVADGTRIAMEPTLEASLARLFGEAPAGAIKSPIPDAKPGEAPTPIQPVAPAAAKLAEQLKQHYDRAMQAQREGDWARYGEEIKRLGAVIDQMSKQR